MKIPYPYVNDDGEVVVRRYTSGKEPQTIHVKGVVFERGSSNPGGDRRKKNLWPMKSDALGCHPDQDQEFIDNAAALGVPTEFKDGFCILRSPGHRKEYAEAVECYDRNGGYGDPQKR